MFVILVNFADEDTKMPSNEARYWLSTAERRGRTVSAVEILSGRSSSPRLWIKQKIYEKDAFLEHWSFAELRPGRMNRRSFR